MERFATYTCADFVSALASKAPVPGGGGAAALSGAVGTALGSMVCNLTLGKQKYADVQDDILRIQAHADALQQAFFDLIDEDAAAFEPLSKAYGLPRSTDAERAARAAIMEDALKLAVVPPLLLMERCCEAIALLEELARIGSAIAISDVGCGAACCRAALTGGALNVFINTKSMADRAYADALDARARGMLDAYVPRCDDVYASVAARFSQ